MAGERTGSPLSKRPRQLSATSARKRQAVIEAAAALFLSRGYQGVSMDELAARAGVSKQTVYSYFDSKESLFTAMVWTLTDAASDSVHTGRPSPGPDESIEEYLIGYAMHQLKVVLTPTLMGLRRVVIGEASRFPDLARVLYERGPGRALAALSELFRQLNRRGRLHAPDPAVAASHFNWLVMGEAINRAMLLGDEYLPSEEDLTKQAAQGVRVFLAAYGVPVREPNG